MLSLPAAWTYEEGLPLETWIPGFWDCAVPISGRTGEDTVHSSTARYRPEEPVSVSRSCTGTSRYTGRPERPDYGSRQRTRPTARAGACLRHHTTITPPVESTDQPVIQGTFLLPRLWARVLFDSGASHSFIAALVVTELT